MRLIPSTILVLSLVSGTASAQRALDVKPAAPPPPPPAPAQGTPLNTQPAQPAQPAPDAGGTALNVQPRAPQPTQPTRPPPGQLYDDGSGALPFYEPHDSEAFTKPEPPKPPPPPPKPEPPKVQRAFSAYFQTHTLSGDVKGTVAELGVQLGSPGAALEVGFVPAVSDLVVGLSAGRFAGIQLGDMGEGTTISLMLPGFEAKAITDFSDDFIFMLGATGLGLGIASCGPQHPHPFFVQARVPHVELWLPLQVAGGGPDSGHTEPFFGWGASLQAGLLFY